MIRKLICDRKSYNHNVIINKQKPLEVNYEAIVDKACETFCKYNGCGVSRDNCTKIGTCPNHNAFMDELMASLTNHR